MKGTWLRIAGLLLFVATLAAAGGWWVIGVEHGSAVLAPEASVGAETVSPDVAEGARTAPLSEINRDALARPGMGALTLPGVIEPYESVPVSAKLTASIASMEVRDGSLVTNGQLLCLLDSNELRRQIDSARLALMQAQETLRRAREDRSNHAQRTAIALSSAERELVSCRAEGQLQLQQVEAALNRAERELADYEALYQAKAVSADQVRAKREAVEDARRNLEQRQVTVAAGLEAGRTALEQAQLDARTEAVSERDIEAYELATANAQAQLTEREQRVADLRVMAPVSGTVHFIPRTRTSSMMAAGQSAEVLGPGVRVYEGDPFLEIATTERACVRVDVDETDIYRLHVGMKATITGDAFAGRELDGEISEIQIAGKSAARGVTLFPVTVRIASPLEDVRMGMTADVTINLADDSEAAQGGQQ